MWSVWSVFYDCGFHTLCLLMEKDGRLVESSWWQGPALGESGSYCDEGAILSKSLILFSVDGPCSLPFVWPWPDYGRGNGNFLQKDLWQHYSIQCPWPCSRPLSTHASAGDSWTLTGKSGSVSCGVTAPFSWVLVHTTFCLRPPRVCFPSPVEVP